ncbi:LysE family translocator [Roseobacter sp. HKCCD7870]|uniref:LysE family translocator n=1 Tax=Roseobacter sp. HKCCD7870 TaxID=3120343 RepID=UPI0030EEFBC8
MLTFALAVVLLVITPGPGVLSTAGFGAAYGFKLSLRYVIGLFLGTNLVMFAVVSGLAAVVLSLPWLRTFLVCASVGYLLYLATKIGFAGTKVAFIEASAPPGLLGGLFLQIINPKAYAVNTSLITGFGFAPDNLIYEVSVKFLIHAAIWIPIHLVWLWAGVILHRLELPPRTQRVINLAMAVAMVGVVGLALWSTFGENA